MLFNYMTQVRSRTGYFRGRNFPGGSRPGNGDLLCSQAQENHRNEEEHSEMYPGAILLRTLNTNF